MAIHFWIKSIRKKSIYLFLVQKIIVYIEKNRYVAYVQNKSGNNLKLPKKWYIVILLAKSIIKIFIENHLADILGGIFKMRHYICSRNYVKFLSTFRLVGGGGNNYAHAIPSPVAIYTKKACLNSFINKIFDVFIIKTMSFLNLFYIFHIKL